MSIRFCIATRAIREIVDKWSILIPEARVFNDIDVEDVVGFILLLYGRSDYCSETYQQIETTFEDRFDDPNVVSFFSELLSLVTAGYHDFEFDSIIVLKSQNDDVICMETL